VLPVENLREELLATEGIPNAFLAGRTGVEPASLAAKSTLIARLIDRGLRLR